MKRHAVKWFLWWLFLLAPLFTIAVASLWVGTDLWGEPMADILLIYGALLPLSGCAALAVLLVFYSSGLQPDTGLDTLCYALVAGVSCAALLLLLDALEDYFTRAGFSWQWPITGLVFGAIFGAVFRLLCDLLLKRAS